MFSQTTISFSDAKVVRFLSNWIQIIIWLDTISRLLEFNGVIQYTLLLDFFLI